MNGFPGLPVDFAETVTRWKENEENIWETIGSPKMIILGWRQMRLTTEPGEKGILASLVIQHAQPKPFSINKFRRKNRCACGTLTAFDCF